LSLLSICIPSSVEMVGAQCFGGCESLSTVTFEPGSRLSCVEHPLFPVCPSLCAIHIPPSLQIILRQYQPLLRII
jgi:hypothetical protein